MMRFSGLAGRGRAGLGCTVFAVLWGLFATAAWAAPIPLEASRWEPAEPLASPQDPDAAGRFVPFDPNRVEPVQRNPDGAWLRLQPASGAWPEGPLVLVVERVVFGAVYLHVPGRAEPMVGDIARARSAGLGGIGAPVFELPADLPGAAPLDLYLAPYPAHAPGVTLSVEPLGEYLQRNALWVALASACLAAMTMMALTALVFLAILRDRAYLFYALYLGCFIVLEAISSGYLFTVLRWQAWAEWVGIVGKLVTVVSVISACLFLIDFTRMAHFSPRTRQLILGYVVAFGAVLGAGMLPFEQPMLLARALVNPLLAVGALLLPLAALIVWIRGSRYGAYFLIGWLPLMAVTFASSMQASGAFAAWRWLNDSLLVAGAFEGLVLAVGLADRELAHRRRFQFAQQLSMTDPLTGLLNRRAWEDQFEGLFRSATAGAQRVYVMFVDLDRFKSLNDQFGHRAGDEALVAVASMMRSVVPKTAGLVCRYGGEEFVAALAVSGSAEARSIAETLRAAVASRGIPVDADGTRLTLSIGLARHRSGQAPEQTIEQADRAMYRAKSGGRNQVMEAAASV